MRGQLDDDTSPAHFQVWMVTFRLGYWRDAVNKPDRSDEVAERKSLGQLPVLDLPAPKRSKAVGNLVAAKHRDRLRHVSTNRLAGLGQRRFENALDRALEEGGELLIALVYRQPLGESARE